MNKGIIGLLCFVFEHFVFDTKGNELEKSKIQGASANTQNSLPQR